jgi:CMP-N-acetylneuraminic acid synthetase
MKDYSEVICIICARGGSKGLPRKNTLPLDGVPLIARPIIQAKNSGAIGTVLVTTDDAEIADIAMKYGAEVPFLRPKELADDLATTEETLKHALLTYEGLIDRRFEICVFITGTDIFRDVAWIRECVDMLMADEDLESVFVGHKTHKNLQLNFYHTPTIENFQQSPFVDRCVIEFFHPKAFDIQELFLWFCQMSHHH